MKEIKVSNLIAFIDDEDYDDLSQFKWHKIVGRSGSIYASRTLRDGSIRLGCEYMHCRIMNLKGVDHIDGNGLNNQKSNLRPATRIQNMGNSKPRTGTSSQHKGVSLYHNGRWTARILGGHIGYFATEDQAAKAYNEEAIKIFGEYARLNRIEEE